VCTCTGTVPYRYSTFASLEVFSKPGGSISAVENGFAPQLGQTLKRTYAQPLPIRGGGAGRAVAISLRLLMLSSLASSIFGGLFVRTPQLIILNEVRIAEKVFGKN
jgi:hypothetical protein